MFHKKEPRLYYIKQAIEENDDPYAEYKHDQITEILVAYHIGNAMFPGDCWIADYLSGGINNCIFDECYETLEEFYKWNTCFSTDIIHIEFEEGIA
jgi:hypothetical protein